MHMKHRFLFAHGDLIIGELNEFVLHLNYPKALFAFTTPLDSNRMQYIDAYQHKEYETEFGDYVVCFMPFEESSIDPFQIMDAAVEWYENYLSNQDEYPFIRGIKITYQGVSYQVTPYQNDEFIIYSVRIRDSFFNFRSDDNGNISLIDDRVPPELKELLEILGEKIESALM